MLQPSAQNPRHPDAQEVKAGSMGFNDFLTRGLVEYVDVNEENNSLIALYEKDLTPQVKHRRLGFFFGRKKFKGPGASHQKQTKNPFSTWQPTCSALSPWQRSLIAPADVMPARASSCLIHLAQGEVLLMRATKHRMVVACLVRAADLRAADKAPGHQALGLFGGVEDSA